MDAREAQAIRWAPFGIRLKLETACSVILILILILIPASNLANTPGLMIILKHPHISTTKAAVFGEPSSPSISTCFLHMRGDAFAQCEIGL
jgi:hypothetical protein